MCGVSQEYDALMRGEQPRFTSRLHALCLGVSLEFESYPFYEVVVAGQLFHQWCRACVLVEHEILVICDCFSASRQFSIDRMLALRQHVQSFIGDSECIKQGRTVWVRSKVSADSYMSIVDALWSKCELPIPLPCYVLVMCWPFGMSGKCYETDIIMRGEHAEYNSFLQHLYPGLTLTYSTTPSWEIVVRGIDIAQWCRCAEHIQDLMCTVCSAFCVSHQHSFTLQKHSYKQIRHYAYCEVPDGSVIGLDYCSPLFRGLFLH